eukprot:m51a1_g14260 hypothetical protein (197) ;mRNA; f:296333-297241
MLQHDPRTRDEDDPAESSRCFPCHCALGAVSSAPLPRSLHRLGLRVLALSVVVGLLGIPIVVLFIVGGSHPASSGLTAGGVFVLITTQVPAASGLVFACTKDSRVGLVHVLLVPVAGMALLSALIYNLATWDAQSVRDTCEAAKLLSNCESAGSLALGSEVVLSFVVVLVTMTSVVATVKFWRAVRKFQYRQLATE